MFHSIWQDTCSLPEFSPLEQDTKTDALIIGGGLAGLLIAYELKQAGIDYLLIEGSRLCSGTTGHTTAKITSQHGLIYHKLCKEFSDEAARLYWEANEAALARYRRLSQQVSCDFEEKDSYIYSVSSPRDLETECDALERLRIPAAYTSTLPLPFPTAGAVCFQHQAQFHPLKFAAAIASNLHIYEHTFAQAIEDGVVLTNRGRIRASHIIVATHFPFLNKHGLYFLKMHQNRSYVLGLEDAPQFDGMFLDAESGGLSLRNYGGLLLLGGGAHRTGAHTKGWAGLEAEAQRLFPQSKTGYRWAAQDCMTLDSIPYIGQYSKRTGNLYVVTGFEKWGMTTSMAAASILCDIVQGKQNPYTHIFSPSRTVLRPALAANLLEASINLLTPTSPRCPHMGCALKWNPQERSWDCPCHGSRFAENGTLLENPAMKSLKKTKS